MELTHSSHFISRAQCLRGGSTRGFTLPEVMVVVVIVGILLVAAVGGLGGRSERSEEIGLRTMADVLENARMRAISRASYVAAVFPDGAAVDEEKRFRGAAVVDLTVDAAAGGTSAQFSDGVVTGAFAELPQGQVLFGAAEGASSVVDSMRVPVLWRTGGEVEQLPAVVFTPTGAVLTPAQKSLRVVRVAAGDLDGTDIALRETYEESKHGRIEIQRVTGKIVQIE